MYRIYRNRYFLNNNLSFLQFGVARRLGKVFSFARPSVLTPRGSIYVFHLPQQTYSKPLNFTTALKGNQIFIKSQHRESMAYRIIKVIVKALTGQTTNKKISFVIINRMVLFVFYFEHTKQLPALKYVSK